uniref:Tensin 4 n=1 Tax=Malurus cyaneus samueli TaxID=2593467 RepID=A0A8C5U725_9PASS
MSQVIESHVLRVGQTVCISSPEESGSLHPPGYPGKYVYYSTESWSDPPAMVHPKTCLLPAGRQDSSSEKPPAPCPPKQEESAGEAPEAQPMSPSLDITIETLNQLILEIDPTFQPLPCRPVKDTAQPPAWGDTAVTKKQEPEAIGEGKVTSHGSDVPQGSPKLLGTPFSRSPQPSSFLPPKGALGGKYSTSDSVVFSSPAGPSSPRSAALSCGKSSESPVAPLQCPAGHTDTVPSSPGALGTSPGAEHLLKPAHVLRSRQRGSWVSQLSTSPGSDTSYMLGSSTHSLLNEDSDTSAAACASPSSSLGSPCSPSCALVCHPRDALGQSSPQPRAGSSPGAGISLSQKGQASSCPPSILTSAADIPVLLVNGCLEQGDGPPGWPNPAPRCGPDTLGSLAGPLKAGQPTMKFVMDTSKYWFKPSISRDRAIQLLRDKEPGAFVVRDSTSYRGSFGLAMKVPGPPAGSQTGEEGSDLIRHFLIESSTKGVHLKGASETLYFGSLSAFVYQHSITPLALPCKLSIPTRDLADGEDSPDCAPESPLSLAKKNAVCNVLYLNSVNVETLTGAPAILKGISCTLEMETPPTPTLVHFRVTEQGVTLTDVQRKLFFRRHYPLAAIRFCGMDPENRKIFGFVAKNQPDSQNLCHLFAEYDTVQPVSLVIDLIRQLLPSP